ncbi:MAG: peptidoglycan DD-metalloendopeptidase family protein [Gammaproteobacteria bacterium]|nr:MAG: peptidoglycan DD-metalloendopeptidase family protein [Gammaproteobacteria bacterium]
MFSKNKLLEGWRQIWPRWTPPRRGAARDGARPTHQHPGSWWLGLAIGVTTVAIASIAQNPGQDTLVDTQAILSAQTGNIITVPELISGPVASIAPASPFRPKTRTANESAIEPLQTRKRITVKRRDTLLHILQRQGLPPRDIKAILQSRVGAFRHLVPGKKLTLTMAVDGSLQTLSYEKSATESLQLTRSGDRFSLVTTKTPLETRVRQVAGNIQNSLFVDGGKAGLADPVIMNLAEIFGWDIDFALDLRRGDRFAVVYEEKFARERKVANGRILAAEFVNQGKVFRVIAHEDARGNTRYYTQDGHSVRRTFLRSPVKFSRISSRFTRKRYHPVLKRWRAHKGVDYSAARGTPIRATASGRLDFRGRKGGYGKTVAIRHGGAYSTLYAHLSRFKRGIRQGSRVRQGQIIGYVGSTGLATGPHLHYEFRVNGVHRNPLTYKFPKAQAIQTDYRPAFTILARHWGQVLDQLGNKTRVAHRQP